MSKSLSQAVKKFEALMKAQLERITVLKQPSEWISYQSLKPIIIGICYGDGIGKEISDQAKRVLVSSISEKVENGKVIFKMIDGLTIENRVKEKKAIPDSVLAELKACHVILKGPTTTPQKGDKWPNIESANVAMRRELDLFACVRPVTVLEKHIDWVFFRENTEGAYVLGSQGFDVSEDLSVDFKIMTDPGAERIIRLAFEYAKKNNKKRVTVVTKSNIIKATDGRFSLKAKEIAKEYPGIKCDEWYIDIMAAKLLDPERRHEFEVIVLPNLYGDILTDEAGQIQGGVGTAGSANIGKRWAMFEAIHGSAPRMVQEGRAKYADPSSMIRASAMLLEHIGFKDESDKISMALDICGNYEKKISITGRASGATAAEFSNYVLSWVQSNDLIPTWRGHVEYTKN